MGRKILFVTTDQQRYDTLGCNGGTLARTPVIDSLAAQGIRYERAVPQSVVCMPSRSTMLTGQHPSTHGVWMNGVPLPVDAPSVAALLNDQGYRTALVGKPHFEPFIDPFGRFTENRLASSGAPTAQTRHFDGTIGPHRGFEHLEFATHGAAGWLHYSQWIGANHPEAAQMFYAVLDSDLEVNSAGFGDTGGPQVKHNPIPKDWYHTDWVADRTIDWLDSLDDDDDFFCWMSFPDPHHPWDPPESEIGRIDWRDVDLPAGYPTTAAEREAILDGKPRHWRMWYDGALVSNYEAPTHWVPETLTADQLREITALNAVECELIDEALGRVLAAVEVEDRLVVVDHHLARQLQPADEQRAPDLRLVVGREHRVRLVQVGPERERVGEFDRALDVQPARRRPRLVADHRHVVRDAHGGRGQPDAEHALVAGAFGQRGSGADGAGAGALPGVPGPLRPLSGGGRRAWNCAPGRSSAHGFASLRGSLAKNHLRSGCSCVQMLRQERTS